MKYQDLTPEQQERVEQLRRMTPKQWDTICKKCGVCCLYKIQIISNRVFYLDRSCQYLNLKNHKCSVYKSRHQERPEGCQKITVDDVLAGEIVPASCGYCEYIFGPAKNPVAIDWSTVRPITDWLFESTSNMEKLFMIIPKSWKWNQR